LPQAFAKPPHRHTHGFELQNDSKIGRHRSYQQVIMVGHQNIGVQPQPETLLSARQPLSEMRVIVLIAINRLPLISPRSYVIPGSRTINSQQSGHGLGVTEAQFNVMQYLMEILLINPPFSENAPAA